MIGLVLVTHGKLAEEFRHAVEHVVGPQKFIETVCDRPRGRHGSETARRSCEAVSSADDGHGVVILTDMFGGTPFQSFAISVMEQRSGPK